MECSFWVFDECAGHDVKRDFIIILFFFFFTMDHTKLVKYWY